jgi:DNA-binding response OmpR family regulator
VTALNHKEGKENIFAERPDLILLDIMMDSFFDSFSLCCAIKTSKEYIEFKNTYEEKNSGNGKTP